MPRSKSDQTTIPGMPPPKKSGKAQPKTPAKAKPKTPDPKTAPATKAPPPGIEPPAIAKAASAGSGSRSPAPAIPPGQEAATKAVAAAEDSMTGSSGPAPGFTSSPAASKSTEMKLRDMVRRLDAQEIPENDIWLQPEQLTYAQSMEKAM